MTRTAAELLQAMRDAVTLDADEVIVHDQMRRLIEAAAPTPVREDAEPSDYLLVPPLPDRPRMGRLFHRSVRNYLVNELKIDGAYVARLVREHLGHYVTLWLNGQTRHDGQASAWLTNIVRAATRAAIEDEVKRMLRSAKVEVRL